jgi:hypothetical protein
MLLFFFSCMFQLLLYIFVTCSIFIIALIANHNIIVASDFKIPYVRTGICTSYRKNTEFSIISLFFLFYLPKKNLSC